MVTSDRPIPIDRGYQPVLDSPEKMAFKLLIELKTLVKKVEDEDAYLSSDELEQLKQRLEKIKDYNRTGIYPFPKPPWGRSAVHYKT